MRIVQVLIPNGKREPVLATLDEEKIDYAVWEETGRGDFEALVQFPIPPIGVEPIMEKLQNVGISKDTYTIVYSPETVVSSRLDALQKRFSGKRIAREELIARAEDLAPATSTFFAFLILSTVIATGGLLLDSAATIIGAMVVAPLMGPAISASVGTVLDHRKLASRGLWLQVTGLLAAIATAAIIGFLIKQTILVPAGLDIREIGQVAERTSPNFLSLFLALGSGLAGAISIMRGSGSTLVGVAIAVALVPPAATTGLGIAWGLPGVAVAAAVLVLVNLLAINVSALALFWLSGFRPTEKTAISRARSAVIIRGGALIVAIAVLSVVLGLVTYATYESSLVQEQIEQEVEGMYDESGLADEGVILVDTEVSYEAVDLLLNNPPEVSVIIGYQIGQSIPPDIAQRVDEHLKQTTDVDRFSVTVEFVEAQQVIDAN
ncbi:TIGR00341 family protein [Methanolobus sp. ZRKC2]|uniref:TIGR00341 family protein n=1 Tax=Methanolobus sp. ZRKC2 TaxID=3125783 RepID=UPI00324E6842